VVDFKILNILSAVYRVSIFYS